MKKSFDKEKKWYLSRCEQFFFEIKKSEKNLNQKSKMKDVLKKKRESEIVKQR